MKHIVIDIFARDQKGLIEGVEHALDQIKLGTPSEMITFSNKVHVQFDQFEIPEDGFREKTNWSDEDETEMQKEETNYVPNKH